MESSIKLSISLLVSNREDTIEKCMESLQPLVKAVPCEIIAVDTGSTDGSIDIVKKYTDKIISFPWCNDFAAARNAGLKQASGEWFMYLDDDEWFENTDEIIAFLKGNESKQYQRLYYRVRNYRSFGNQRDYEETVVSRMSIRTDDLRFVGKVHESLQPCYGKVKHVNDYVHHYGYAFENLEDKEKHTERNVSLLEEELKSDPENPHYLLQLAQEYQFMGWNDEAEGIIEKGIEICKRKKEWIRLGWFYTAKAVSLVRTDRIEELEKYAADCEQEATMNQLAKANIYNDVAVYLFNRKENLLGIEYGKKYMQMVAWLRKNPEKAQEQTILGLAQVLALDLYTEIQTLCIEMYVREERWHEAWQLIEKLDWTSGIKNLHVIFEKIFTMADISDRFGQLKGVINEILKSDEMETRLEQITETAKNELPERKQEIIDLFVGIRKETPYVLLQKFTSALFHGKRQDAELYLKRYEVLPPERKNCDAKFILQALEHTFPIGDWIESLESERWEEAAGFVQWKTKLEDIYDSIEKLRQMIGWESQKFLYARMVFIGKKIEEKASYFEHLPEFLSAREDYLQSLELDKTTLGKEIGAKIEALHLLKDGVSAFENGKFLQAKEHVTKAIKLDKQLDSYMFFFLESILEELQIIKGREAAQANPEFAYLAKQLKGNVRILLQNGKKEEALELVKALQTMMSGDEEIEELYRACI